MRFRAESHLRRAADFAHVRATGSRRYGRGFTLWVATRPEPMTVSGPRVGVVASRAAVGNAVQRNRAKRRLREVFRHHQHRVPPDRDLLLVAKSAINRLEYREIEQSFVRVCAECFPAAPPVDA
jgi:ribonuclease P protein component